MEVRPLTVLVGIQARMSSTRLPGKVLLDICGKPMLHRVWDACVGPWERCILTSVKEEDDAIESYCWGNKMRCQRGSLNDVLSRYVILSESRPSCLVRVCADAPFLQASWIADAIACCVRTHSPVFVPGALHAGHWTHWRQAEEWCEPSDIEHAGHNWFEKSGVRLERVPPNYITVNTQEDLEEARRRWIVELSTS